MNEVSEQTRRASVVEEIKNNEIEVLPCEIQVRLAPEMISARHAAEPTKKRFQLSAARNHRRWRARRLNPASPEPVIHQYWPWAIIVLGFVFTAAWICLLGYALVKLVEWQSKESQTPRLNRESVRIVSMVVARQANQATTSIDGIKVTRIPSTKSGVIDLLHRHHGTFKLPDSFVSNRGRTLSQL